MDHALIKASHRLSELDVKIDVEGTTIRVCWFRIMFKEGRWFIRRHAHPTYEFHFIARGECEVGHDGGSFKVGAGSFFLTGPEVRHSQAPAGSGDLVEYSLNCEIKPAAEPAPVPGTEMGWLVKTLREAVCAPAADEHGALALFEAALREADQRKLGYALAVRSLVPMILVAAARSLRGPAPLSPAAEEAAAGAAGRPARIEQFILDNIGVDLKPKDIAEHMSLSERQLGRVIMLWKGYSTKKLITRIKLKRAKSLLAETDLTLRAIAEELGFSSEFYFNSVFKKHEGFPPGAFRSSMRGR